MTFTELWNFVQGGGLPAAAAVFVAALYTRKIRFGRDYDELQEENKSLKADNNQLIQSALKNASLAHIVLQNAEDKRGGGVMA